MPSLLKKGINQGRPGQKRKSQVYSSFSFNGEGKRKGEGKKKKKKS